MATGTERLFQQARLLSEKRAREMEAVMNRYKGFGKAGAGIGYGLARLFGAGSEEMERAETEDAMARQFLNVNSTLQQELMTDVTSQSPALAEQLRPYMERNQINETVANVDLQDPKNMMAAASDLLAIPSGRDLGLKMFEASIKRQKELAGGSGTDYINNVRFTTAAMGGNPDNPADLRAGAEQLAQYKGHGIGKDAGKLLIDNLGEGKKERKTMAESMRTANRAMKLIDSGQLNMGSFANTRQGFAKFFNMLGLTSSESPALTDQFVAETASLVKDVLASGDFGAGSGLSDADREYAAKLAGGDIKMEPAAAYRILQIRARANQAKLNQWNAEVGGNNPDVISPYSDDFFRRSGLVRDSFIVDVPTVYQRPVERMDSYELQSVYGVPAGVTVKDIVKDAEGNLYFPSTDGVYLNLETKEPYDSQALLSTEPQPTVF